MTKPRDPLTFENALVKIAGLVTFERMGEICGVSPGLVRKWADPDVADRFPIMHGPALDAAFQAADGDGTPLLDVYLLQVDALIERAMGTNRQLAQSLKRAMKEDHEANSAVMDVALHGADAVSRAEAIREVEESIAAKKAVLADLTRGTVPQGGVGADSPLGGDRT